MKETFGEYIRKLRKRRKLQIRKVASALDLDQSSLSKFERGDRLPPREHLQKFSSFYEVNEEELLIRYLSDKIVALLFEEKNPEWILEVAQQKLKYLKSKKFQQGKLNL